MINQESKQKSERYKTSEIPFVKNCDIKNSLGMLTQDLKQEARGKKAEAKARCKGKRQGQEAKVRQGKARQGKAKANQNLSKHSQAIFNITAFDERNF